MILSIAIRSAGGTTRLHLAGEIDLSTTAILAQATTDALHAGPESIIVDLADVTFCDCTGFTWLLTCRAEALAHGATYQVVNATGCPLRVMRLLNLHGQLTTRAPGNRDLPVGSPFTPGRQTRTCTNSPGLQSSPHPSPPAAGKPSSGLLENPPLLWSWT